MFLRFLRRFGRNVAYANPHLGRAGHWLNRHSALRHCVEHLAITRTSGFGLEGEAEGVLAKTGGGELLPCAMAYRLLTAGSPAVEGGGPRPCLWGGRQR